jgi:hypothetical protein
VITQSLGAASGLFLVMNWSNLTCSSAGGDCLFLSVAIKIRHKAGQRIDLDNDTAKLGIIKREQCHRCVGQGWLDYSKGVY